jgi:hypothetical protein
MLASLPTCATAAAGAPVGKRATFCRVRATAGAIDGDATRRAAVGGARGARGGAGDGDRERAAREAGTGKVVADCCTVDNA